MSKLQDLRKKAGLTQEEIAKLLGISQQAYGNYEKDASSIPEKTLKRIANILLVDEDLISFNDELCDDSIGEFLHKSLTSYHATKNTITLLEKAGFKRLEENEDWNIKNGDKYYVTKNNSAIIAFKVNDTENFVFNIASCHTDSPSLKIKGDKLIPSKEGNRLNVEVYGGPLKYSFLDIPLKVAGRILVKEGNSIKEQIVTSSYNVNIPSLCIHHSAGVKIDELQPQNDLLPLFGEGDNLYSSLTSEEVIGADLYCVPFIKPTYTGSNNELLVSPRIDNLSSLYAITKALISCESKGISILYATDNEEIGSLTKQGAVSMFLSNTLTRLSKSLNKKEDGLLKAISNSFVLSIDNGHAIHQAHTEKNDPVNTCVLNGGVVIKHHTNYSTDGYSSSVVEMIAKKGNIDIQHYYNNSNIRCGSTIGLITSAQLAIDACDIGLAELAMHSSIETVGKYDIKKMETLVKTFFETKREKKGNTTIID